MFDKQDDIHPSNKVFLKEKSSHFIHFLQKSIHFIHFLQKSSIFRQERQILLYYGGFQKKKILIKQTLNSIISSRNEFQLNKSIICKSNLKPRKKNFLIPKIRM